MQSMVSLCALVRLIHSSLIVVFSWMSFLRLNLWSNLIQASVTLIWNRHESSRTSQKEEFLKPSSHYRWKELEHHWKDDFVCIFLDIQSEFCKVWLCFECIPNIQAHCCGCLERFAHEKNISGALQQKIYQTVRSNCILAEFKSLTGSQLQSKHHDYIRGRTEMASHFKS